MFEGVEGAENQVSKVLERSGCGGICLSLLSDGVSKRKRERKEGRSGLLPFLEALKVFLKEKKNNCQNRAGNLMCIFNVCTS
jgi:hypothetical protein